MTKLDQDVTPWRLFITFLRLGLTSFGGPIAHLGYFRTEFVDQRKWLTDREYSDLVALCQFLPGPASSQVGLAIGLFKARYLGATAAWIGFTLPSAILLTVFALGISSSDMSAWSGLIMGLKVMAVAIVAHAVWGMAQSLCKTHATRLIAALSGLVLIVHSSASVQLVLILIAGIIGYLALKPSEHSEANPTTHSASPINRKMGLIWLGLFFGLLILLPLLAKVGDVLSLELFSDFYRTGALVFGGGHVVLPLLDAEVVQTGIIDKGDFMAGYGAAQAVPGPLFTFAAYLGGVWSGVGGAVLCLIAIFLPAFLLVAGSLPFWHSLRQSLAAQGALNGVNACVVGILAAALYNPLFTTAILGWKELAIAVLSFLALQLLKAPSWLVVIACALAGFLFL